MLEPQPVTIKRQDGSEKTFVISKFPAVAGRRIIAQYPIANTPKIGDYAVSEAVMLQLMAFVGVEVAAGNVVMLATQELVDNHAKDWETLVKLEAKMLEYNCSFFNIGSSFAFFANIGPKVQAWISKMSTDLLPQLLEKVKQPSTN